jgi:hypothetical protein
LLHGEIFRNIRAAFTTTVYAFLNPRRPSAAWDFFCLQFSLPASFNQVERSCTIPGAGLSAPAGFSRK